ncbi:MAG: toprim domain-containing protein [Eubacteriales bacterium]
MDKLKIPYPVIVEGKYDKLRLSCVIEAQIIATDGFGIFKNHERAALLRALARKTPVIVLTDPDGAGRLIRSHISGILPKEKIISFHIPKIEGKEKRKKEPSAEGFLGVEGVENERIRELFLPYTDPQMTRKLEENPLSPAILCRDGLTGAAESAARRDAVGRLFGLPDGMNAKAFLAALRCVATYEEYIEAIEKTKEGESK